MPQPFQPPKFTKRLDQKGRTEIAKRNERLEALQIVYVPIESVKPNAYNPNRQSKRDFDLLLMSIREDGFTQPIVVQKGTNEIVDGEHRWRAAREIGMVEIPVVYTDMTVEQMRISTLRHNRARGSEDFELGAQVLRDLRDLGALDWAQSSLAIDDKELQKILDDVPAPQALAGEKFSEPWTPSAKGNELADKVQGNSNEQVSMSSAAEAVFKKAEEGFLAAKDDKERVAAETTMRAESYRLVLVFKADEAGPVRAALEPRPAERIVELCRKKLAEKAAQVPEA